MPTTLERERASVYEATCVAGNLQESTVEIELKMKELGRTFVQRKIRSNGVLPLFKSR